MAKRKLEFLLRPSNRCLLTIDQVCERFSYQDNEKSDFSFKLSLSEIGVISGTSSLSADELCLKGPSTNCPLPGVEVFSTEVASLTTNQCFYRDMAYQVVMPNPTHFIPKILGYVRAHVCSGADPWDHLRLYLSVSYFIPKSDFGIFIIGLGFVG